MLLDSLNEGGVLDGLLVLSGDVVDVLLVLLHALNVVLEGGPGGDGVLEGGSGEGWGRQRVKGWRV